MDDIYLHDIDKDDIITWMTDWKKWHDIDRCHDIRHLHEVILTSRRSVCFIFSFEVTVEEAGAAFHWHSHIFASNEFRRFRRQRGLVKYRSTNATHVLETAAVNMYLTSLRTLDDDAYRVFFSRSCQFNIKYQRYFKSNTKIPDFLAWHGWWPVNLPQRSYSLRGVNWTSRLRRTLHADFSSTLWSSRRGSPPWSRSLASLSPLRVGGLRSSRCWKKIPYLLSRCSLLRWAQSRHHSDLPLRWKNPVIERGGERE